MGVYYNIILRGKEKVCLFLTRKLLSLWMHGKMQKSELAEKRTVTNWLIWWSVLQTNGYEKPV